MKKRILALLLTLCMAFTLLPSALFSGNPGGHEPDPRNDHVVAEKYDIPRGERYYFDISMFASLTGEVNPALPDATLHYVPFIYGGTIEAYYFRFPSLLDDASSSDTMAETTPSLFVSEYNICNDVSWDTLNIVSENQRPLVFGRTALNGGYLRLPTGGNSSTPSTPNNEWDRLLKKNSDFIRNCDSMASWTQDYSTRGNSYRATRGGESNSSSWSDAEKSANRGWRPVVDLELAEPDDVNIVNLDLNGGRLGDSTDDIKIISAKEDTFKSPSPIGLTPPPKHTFLFWEDTNSGRTYGPDCDIPKSVTSLIARWLAPEQEQFKLPVGETYYFDLSTATSKTDATKHYVPFVYAGTVDAYSLDEKSLGDKSASNSAKENPHSLFVSESNVGSPTKWATLNKDNLIYGKTFDTHYTLRSLSGGNKEGNGNTRGLPTKNEWDTIHVKDETFIRNTGVGFSWTQDTAADSGNRAIRGYYSPTRWEYYYNEYDNAYWRPALEVMNPSQLGQDGLKAVTLDLGKGSLGKDVHSLKIVCAGKEFTAPSSIGLTAPTSYKLSCWKDTNSSTTYNVGETIPNSVTGLTAQWELKNSGGKVFGDFLVATADYSKCVFDTESNTLTITGSGEYTISMRPEVTSTTHIIDFSGSSGVDLTLNAVQITAPDGKTALNLYSDNANTITLAGGGANILTGGNNSTGPFTSCGIYYSGSLTINGDGTLDVTGGTGAEGSPAYDSDGGTGKTGGYGIWGKGDLSISGGAVKIRGGDGGKGGFGKGKGNANIGGKGGTGGDAVHFLTTAVLTMDENVTAIGGDGGRYGGDVASGLPSAEGGNGGNAISSDESLTLNKTTNAVGGNGHNGDGTCTSQDPSAGSVGGDGGNGIFVAKDLKFAATVFAKGGKGGRGKGAVSSSGGAVGDGKDGGKGGKGGDGMSAVGTITIEQGEVTAKGGDGGRGGDGGSPSEAIIAGKPTIAGKGGKGGKGGDGVSSCTNLTTLLKSKLLTANGGNGGGGGNSGTVPKKTADVNTGDKKKSGANKSIGNIITQKFFSVLTPLKPKSAVDSLLVFDAFGGIISNTSGDLTASYKKAIGNVTAESVKIDGTGFTLFGGDALPFGTGKDGAWSALGKGDAYTLPFGTGKGGAWSALGKGDAYTLPFGTGKGDLATGAVGGKDVVSGDFKDGALVIGTGKDGNIKITASHNGTPGGAGLPFNGNIGGNGGAGGELGKVLDNQNGFNFIGNPSSVAGNDYFLAIADNTASAIYTPVISKDKNGNLFGNIDFSNVPIKLIDGTTDSTDPPQAPFVADEFFPTNNSFATATIEKTEYKSQGKSGETDVKNVPAGLGSEFVINMTTKEKQNGVVTATLSVNAIKTLHKEGFEGVKMITNTGSVAFDKEVLRQLEKAGTAMTLNMKTSTDGTMEFYITNPAGEKQNFSGEYTFGITTELYNDANPNFAQFYFLPENGKPAVPIAKSSFSSDGQMMFVKTRHNSRYAVGYRTDVPKYTDIANHWAKDDIEFVVAKRLLGGVTPDKFAPDSGLTCGEFILALSIVEGKDMIDLYKGDLSKPMTREQMAQIMLDFADETGFNFSQTREEMFFTDTQSEAVRVMQMSGIIMGKDANSFDPKGIATKSAAASVLRRYIELLFDKSTAQGLDVNDSGKYVYYLNGKMIRAASDEGGKITIDGISYNFDKNGFGTKLGTAALADKKYILHKVVRGDTLSGIAKKYHTTVAEIAKLNNIKNVSNVPVGTELKIPQK